MNEVDLNYLVKADLPRLQAIIKYILLNKGVTILFEENDIIHTAFILLWERGLEYNFENIKKPIFEAITKYQFNRVPYVTRALMNERDKMCKHCCELLPIDMFYKKECFDNGLITYNSICKTCEGEVVKERREIRLKDEAKLATHREKQRIWAQKRRNIMKSNPLLDAIQRERQRLAVQKSRLKLAK